MAQDYIYDVFISYRHKPPVLDWLRNHFYPMVEQRLPDSLPLDHQANLFVDWQIETGSEWPARLRQALSASRCLLAIWSPEYFRSSWCLAEWQTFRARERLHDFRSENNPLGLVYPVCFADGEHFPSEAKRTQYRDLRKWNIPYSSFRETADIVDLDREVQALTVELAAMIKRAPTWQADWPIVTPTANQEINVKLPRL